ncbi:MAG: C10 family peptidase [Muribaculaceae bacterium]|nr:C10 family peptidase [Muribaculaceae bacterium]
MKKMLLASAAVLAAGVVVANPLTPDQALARASKSAFGAKAPGMEAPVLAHTQLTSNGQPAVYVFSRQGSYTLISADDAAAPVLGYADGAFDLANMPEAMAWWLSEYARQIEWGASKGVAAYATATEAREAIEPMLATRWDQGEPYNNSCPMYGTARTYTGCAATSMAQVMKYFNYPAVGRDKISYNAEYIGKRLTMDFSKTSFDWNNMLDEYTGAYTPEQADAVATLMRAAGFSIKMNYSDQASAAYALNIGDAMVRYFDYDPNIEYTLRAYYSSSEWSDLIYNNLKNVGPVIYGGTSMMGGGHSFVCDGYDGNGYFHFNWGWSGMSDGYFLLDALSPASLGAGGGNGGGYNFSQDAVLGVQPPTGQPVIERPTEIAQAGSLTASVDGSVITFALEAENSACWINYSPKKFNVLFGAKFEPQTQGGEAIIAPVTLGALEMKSGYGTASGFVPQIDMATLGLADGAYKVTFMTNIEEENQGWVPVRPFYGYYNYVMLTKEGDTYTVAPHQVSSLRIVDGDITNTYYYAGLAHVTVTLANDSDIELTGGFAPAMFYTEGGTPTLYFLGTSDLVSGAPHSKFTHEGDTEMTAGVHAIFGFNQDMDLHLTFFNEQTYNFYTDEIYKPLMMYQNPGAPNATANDLAVPGAVRTGSMATGFWYEIEDKMDIPVEFSLSVTGQIPFCYNAIACIMSEKPDPQYGYEIYQMAAQPVIMAPDDEPYQFESSLAFPMMEPDVVYNVTAAYNYGGNFVPLTNKMVRIKLKSTTGIEQVTDDEADNGQIFNLQGLPMGTDFDTLPSGLYIRGGKKIYKR